MRSGCSLHLLGCPWLEQQDGTRLPLGPDRRSQVLALLGLVQDWIGRERLASMFWPDREAGAARANLRKVLLELRRLGVPGVEEGPSGLRWCVDSDVRRFDEACRQGDGDTALALGQATLMEGMDGRGSSEAFAQWLAGERGALRARWRTMVLKAVHGGAGAQPAPPAQALALAERLLQVDAADEEALAVALRAAHALQRADLAQTLWLRHAEHVAEIAGAAPSPALEALARGPRVQPALAPLSPLVGRQRELDELARRVLQGRLVSVLGPGGVGKTRLARHAADRLAPHFADGVFFVSLAGLLAPSSLAARVAEALGLAFDPRADMAAALERHWGPRSVLVVLDGFDPVIDAAGQLQQWLSAAPGLRLLLTTRERLDVDGEWVLPLGGLDAPPLDAHGPTLLDNDAMRLFALRAQAVNPQFDLAHAATPVAAICRRVGGLPLALELAAAWVRLMPVADIAQELSVSLALLQGEPGGLHAVLDRSWQLLTAGERDACARLAVFRGGFTRDAAQVVAEASLPVLAALLDKSMLQAQADGRLDMHPLLHAHALDKLGEHTELATRHARWALGLAQRGTLPPAERANLVAAFDHAVAHRDATLLDGALHHVRWLDCMGDLAFAAARFEAAAVRLAAHAPTAAALRVQQAWMCLWQDDTARAEAIAREALAPLQDSGRIGDLVAAWRTLGHAARRQGRYREAATCFERGLDHARRAGLVGAEAALRDALAMALNMLGEHDAARAQLAQALRLNEAQGEVVQRLYNQYNYAQSHSLAGDASAALPWARAAAQSVQRIGFTVFEAYARTELAGVLLSVGQVGEADAQARLAMRATMRGEDRAARIGAHDIMARVALARAEPAKAWSHLARATRLCEQGAIVGAEPVAAALLLTAAHGLGPGAAPRHWLQGLAHGARVPVPIQRQAQALLAAEAQPVPRAPPAELPDPATRQALDGLLPALSTPGPQTPGA